MKCFICKSKKCVRLYVARDRMHGLAGTFTVIRCSNCGLRWIEPKPDKRDLVRYYPSSSYYAYQQGGTKSVFFRLRSFVIRVRYKSAVLGALLSALLVVPAIPDYKKGGSILDVGCGTGNTLEILRNLGWKVFGIEMDKRAVAIARKSGLTNVRLGTYEDISKYPDNYFDCIRLYHVIEHLDNPELCLRLIYKKLKRGGELIIGTPNADSLLAWVTRQYWYNLDSPRHLNVFSVKSLELLVNKQRYNKISHMFCSGGGIVGSLQYLLQEVIKRKIPLLSFSWLVIALYPIERLIDMISLGDIFVVSARKK